MNVSATESASSAEAPVIMAARICRIFLQRNIAQVISTGTSTNNDKKFISIGLFYSKNRTKTVTISTPHRNTSTYC